MIIAMHVGMRGDADDAVAALLSHQNEHLTASGWRVTSAVPDGTVHLDVELDIEKIFSAWCQWTDVAQAAGTHQVAFSDPRFTEGHFVRGEVARFVEEARRRGSLRGVGLTRRVDDHIAASYVRQLREGRTAPLRRRELTGSGELYNYFSRLEKWISAMGDDFALLYCPMSADPRDVLPAVAAGLGLPPAPAPVDVAAAPVLSPIAAEALRQINQRLEQPGLPEGSRDQVRRAAFDQLVGLSAGEDPLRMPPDAAAHILDRYRASAHSLAHAMSDADAELFVSDEPPAAVSIDPRGAADLAAQVLSQLGVQAAAADRTGEEKPPRARLQQAARQARRALAAGDDDAYRAALARLPALFRAMPRYREQIPASDQAVRIPHRLVQYWDPWPPPPELQSWLQSWADIGMRDGVYRVVSLDEASTAMVAAAGERGAAAFRAAPHPAARADLYRYAELFLNGGWYVDAEHEALLPIADVHPWRVDHVFAVRPTEDRVTNSYIGAIAGSQVMRVALDQACTNVLDRRSLSILEMTGPAMFTPLVLAYLDQPDASYVLLPTNAVFQGLQIVHNEADYKAGSHWRDHDLTGG